MRNQAKVYVCLLLGLMAICSVSYAHHGTTPAYDQTKMITVRGTLTEFIWANPHCQIFFDVKDDKGQTVNWAGELHSPSLLTARGWNKSALKPGDEVSVIGHPSKVGAPVLEPFSIKVMSSGKVYYRELPGTPQADPRAEQ